MAGDPYCKWFLSSSVPRLCHPCYWFDALLAILLAARGLAVIPTGIGFVLPTVYRWWRCAYHRLIANKASGLNTALQSLGLFFQYLFVRFGKNWFSGNELLIRTTY
jgi:hypothetical protein